MPSSLRRLGLWGAPPGASRSAEGIIYGLRGREKRKILWVGGSLRGKNYREGVWVGEGPQRPLPAPSPFGLGCAGEARARTRPFERDSRQTSMLHFARHPPSTTRAWPLM